MVWKAPLAQYSLSIPMRTDSPYYPFLSHALLQMTQSGQLNSFKRRYLITNPQCGGGGVKGNPIGYSKVGSIFIFLSAFYLVCLLMLLYEKLTFKSLKNNKYSISNKKLILIKQKLNELIDHAKNNNDELLYHQAMRAMEELSKKQDFN
jgi:hypothetical protein